jgi:hypothetical protein
VKIVSMQPGQMNVPPHEWPQTEPTLSYYLGEHLMRNLGDGWVRLTPWKTVDPLTPLRAETGTHSRYVSGGEDASELAEQFLEELSREDARRPGYCCLFSRGRLTQDGPTVRAVVADEENGFLMIGDTTFKASGTQLFIRREVVTYFQPSKVQQAVARTIDEDIAKQWGTGGRAERDMIRDFSSSQRVSRIFVAILLCGFWGFMANVFIGQFVRDLFEGQFIISWLEEHVRGFPFLLWPIVSMGGFAAYLVWDNLGPLHRALQGNPRNTWAVYRLSRRTGRLYSVHLLVCREVFARLLPDWRVWCWHEKPKEPWRWYDMIVAGLWLKDYPLANENAYTCLAHRLQRLLEESTLPELFAAVTEGPLLQSLNRVKDYHF